MTEYSRRFSDTDPCWLIKVDAHISGPFSFNEVIAKLSSGTLSPHQEAISPLDRWRPLQSQPHFIAAIEKLRRLQEEVLEHTVTKTERSQITKTVDLTGERLTPTPQLETTLTPAPTFKSAPMPPRFYTDTVLTPEPPRSSWIWVVGGLLSAILVLAWMFLGHRSPVKTESKKTDFVTYFDQGLQQKKVAHWSEALKNFSLAYQINSRDIDLVMEMAPLFIQLEGQSAQARTLIEKAMLGQYKKETLMVGKNLMGLSYSYETQQQANAYSLALKYFNESLQTDPEEEYVPALINKGWLLVTQGRYAEAETILLKTMNDPQYANTGVIYLIQNYLLQGVRDNRKSSFQKAQQLTAQLLKRKFYDGLQEVNLFQAYALAKMGGDRVVVQGYIQKALDIDPDLTSEHVHPPVVDWRGYQWKSFSYICQDLVKWSSPEQLPLLQFVCQYKIQGVLAAQQSIDGWMARQKRDPYVHVASAIVSTNIGEQEKAQESLLLAQRSGANNKLYYQVLSNVCLRLGNKTCLKDLAPMALKLSPLHGYTALDAIQNDTQNIMRGMKESPNYAPLLSLQK